MSKRILFLLTAAAAVAAVAALAARQSASAHTTVAAASCPTVSSGQLTIGTDNPAYPPWYAGGSQGRRSGRSTTRSTARATSRRSRTRSRRSSASREEPGQVDVRARSTSAFAPGPKSFDFDINQISYTPARAKVVDVQRLVLRREPGDRRHQGHEDRGDPLDRGPAPFKLGAQLGTTSYGFITSHDQAVAAAGGVPAERGARCRRSRTSRSTGSSSTCRPRSTSPPSRCRTRRSSASSRHRRRGDRPLRRWCSRRATRSTSCVDTAIASLRKSGTLEAAPAAVASEGDRRADLEVAARRSKVLDGMRSGGDGRRSVAVALVEHGRLLRRRSSSSITHAPGWPEVHAHVLQLARVPLDVPGDRARVPAEREDLLHRGGVHPRLRAGPRRDAEPARAGVLPAARARDRLRRLLPRHADDPRDRDARLRRARRSA